MGRIEKRRSSTLSGIFLRYVLAMLGLLFTLGICTVLMFNILVNLGGIYPANYAERKINEAYDMIQNADEVTEEMIPVLCHYVIFSEDGEVLGGNMPEDSMEIAWNVANQGNATGDYFYKVIPRPDRICCSAVQPETTVSVCVSQRTFYRTTGSDDDHRYSERDYNDLIAICKLWQKDETKNETGHECGRENQESGS